MKNRSDNHLPGCSVDYPADSPVPPAPIKGRGALSNPHNRYQPRESAPFDDGWDLGEAPAPAPKTTLLKETSKTIISTNQSPDIGFDRSVNPYRGCEHGCIYCYARPSHAYWDLSPGLDFESKIIIKPEAAALLREKLEQKNYQPKPICIGANTDPYQPVESRLKTTRSIIEVLAEFRHPFSIITKSSLIARDLDLLAPLAEQNLCSVAVSVTTLDDNLKRILEPRAPSGRVRLRTIAALSASGIRVAMMAAPMIPCINDQELERIMAAGREAGASAAPYILVRLPWEISDMFRDWLHTHFPDRAARVMNIIRECRGGKDYHSAFGERMRGTGQFADLLRQRWRVANRKLGFDNTGRFELDCSQFRRNRRQLALF